jgi:hypothetical protein
VILLTSGLVIGFAVILGETHVRMHFVVAAAVGALVGTILFLLTELSHPFLGEMGTSPEPLRAVIEVVQSGRG